MRTYKVYAINNGTVIDHIPNGNALKIIDLLNLNTSDYIVTIGTHFKSKKIGKKDIIKIETKELTPEEVNQVSLVAPVATINIVRNSKIIKKFIVQIPNIIERIITCPNAKCITNNELCMTKFYPTLEKEIMHLQCHYCEKIYAKEAILEKLV